MSVTNRILNLLKRFYRDVKLLHQKHQTMMDLIIILIISILTFYTLGSLRINQLLDNLELMTYDLRFMLPGPGNITSSKNIVIVEFDDDTLTQYENRFGAWPWSRGVHASIIDYLENARAKAIAFDIMFCGKGRDDRDKELINAFKQYSNVYLSVNLDYLKSGINVKEPLTSNELGNLKALGYPVQRVSGANKLGPVNQGDIVRNPLLIFDHYRPLLPELMAVKNRIGVINHLRDDNGISRGNPLLYEFAVSGSNKTEKIFLPYLGLRMMLDLKGFNLQKETLKVDDAGNLIFRQKKIPVRDDGIMLVNWDISQKNQYIDIPAAVILQSINRLARHVGTPWDTTLQNFLKDKVIFIGATAVSTYDIKTTSIHRTLPGVKFQAAMFDTLYQGNHFIKRIDNLTRILMIGFMCVVACYSLIKIRAAWLGLLIATVMLVTFLVVAQICFQRYGLWVDVARPVSYFLAVIILTFTVKYMSREFDYVQTYRLATTDALTSLYNHRYFQDEMARLVESNHQNNGRFSLILVDIDHFKQFNDRLGHLIGDVVLRIVAQQLKAAVRTTDVVARYGGEEMTVLLSRTSYDEAFRIAEKLVQTIGDSTYELGPEILEKITISAGVATFPIHGDSPKTLFKFADECVYYAKEHGRNQVGLPPEALPSLTLGYSDPDQEESERRQPGQ